jgi:putative nucleotidyltransferase with HDIG domain
MSALAYRDPETAAHSMRVADLAVAASRGLMSAGDAYLLEIGALLHDVGKIGVPDAVLLKPGPLTKEEWIVMQAHDRIGVEIVSASFTCHELTEIIRCHHAWFAESERGEGLPTGEIIPLRARIISIADAYDAMTSDRVYRKGRSAAEAFTELRRMAGIQFDPALVERFIEVVSQRTPRREEHGAADKEVTLNLCLQTERMARAMDDRDFGAIRALAQHLELTAAKSDLNVMRDLACEIGRLADDPSELPQLVDLVHDLMELCLATQNACLSRDRESSLR